LLDNSPVDLSDWSAQLKIHHQLLTSIHRE
jgi:hypothetical protein